MFSWMKLKSEIILKQSLPVLVAVIDYHLVYRQDQNGIVCQNSFIMGKLYGLLAAINKWPRTLFFTANLILSFAIFTSEKHY